jgi:hypothetical protein
MIATLIVATSFAAPVLNDTELTMIEADHGGRVTAAFVHQDGRSGPGDAGRHRAASPPETRSK